MSKQVYINIPVSDLDRSVEFYTALGFSKDPNFSDNNGIAMTWSDTIILMLLTHDFYKQFIGDKQVVDSHAASGVLIALSMDSKDAVQQFADTAKANGGTYFVAPPNEGLDFMFGYEVEDPDGNVLEPVWMDPNFDPQAATQN